MSDEESVQMTSVSDVVDWLLSGHEEKEMDSWRNTYTAVAKEAFSIRGKTVISTSTYALWSKSESSDESIVKIDRFDTLPPIKGDGDICFVQYSGVLIIPDGIKNLFEETLLRVEIYGGCHHREPCEKIVDEITHRIYSGQSKPRWKLIKPSKRKRLYE